MSDHLSKKVTIEVIGETQEFGTNGFKKREIIGIEDDSQYQNCFQFDFVNDKCDLLDKFSVGEEVEVHFNIRCRKVEQQGKEDRYFTSLSGWKIESV